MKKGIILTVAAIAAVAMIVLAISSREIVEPSTPTEATVLTPQVEENTTGAKLWAQFQQAVTKNNNATPKELATILVESMADTFMGEATQLEKNAEFFTGFDNYRITGYRDGAVYMPMMGSIAFVGYVFEVEDGTDPAAFLKNLTDHCNTRWNICVEADQVVAGAIGNRAFFLMCPKTMGE